MFIQMYNLIVAIQAAIATVGTNVSTILTNIGTVLSNLATANANINTANTNINTSLTNENTIKADTTLLKSANGVGSTILNNFYTMTTDGGYIAITLTGKYELIAIVGGTNTIYIQIDGATNRLYFSLGQGVQKCDGLGLKCNTSMKISSASAINYYLIYRLLP